MKPAVLWLALLVAHANAMCVTYEAALAANVTVRPAAIPSSLSITGCASSLSNWRACS